MPYPILPGAEPMTHVGSNGCGALVLHGFTGNPHSMRGLAQAFAAAGFTVELPLLPGHGTHVEDMIPTGWSDWSAAAEAAYVRVAAQSSRVVVAGLSMGGTLTAWLATRHPEIAGIVTVNGALMPMAPEMREGLQALVDAGERVLPAIGSDIAKEGVTESAYEETPLLPLLSLFDAGASLGAEVERITCPALVMQAPQDHVVAPESADWFAARVRGPVERLSLDRSFHVATLDHDRELIEERAVAFARQVCGLA